jgi:hypothetical protein
MADPDNSRWEDGYFMSRCTHCGREMVKLPGLTWRLRERAST